MQTLEEIFKKLRECYVSSQSTNTDKAKSFRSIYEEYAELEGALAAGPIPFGQRLDTLFRVKNVSQSIKDQSKRLLHELNNIVHTNRFVADQQLRDYYKDLVLIIKELSNVEPDEKTKILCGIQSAWYIQGLNAEQTAAVIDDAQVINVNAGPGTGKTHLLVHKMLYYLHENPDCAVVALSFTNAAASQLSEKFIKIQSEKDQTGFSYPNCVTSTIHSFCFVLLSKYYEKKGIPFDFEILDDSDIPAIAEEIALQFGLSNSKDQIAFILEYGGNGPLAIIVEEYKRKHNFIRVEEILDMFIKESKDEYFKNWLLGKVDCLLVDESQDLSKKIYEIISLFTSINPELKLFFVGDPRQNIFGFNGGSYQNYCDFMKNRKVSEHTLKITYRCPLAVINKVNPLVFDDCPNPNLILANKSLLGSCKIIPVRDKAVESDTIANLIMSINDNNNTCVICTGLWYLADLAKLLNKNHIPYIVKGGKRFLIKAIKILNYCLRMVAIPDSNSEERLRHYIPFFTESSLYSFLKTKKKELEGVEDIFVPDLVRELADILIREEYVETDTKKIFDIYIEKSRKCKSVADLLFACSAHKNDDYSELYERDFNVDCTTVETEQNPAVTLSTIHSAKGLEWENVILAGASDGILPSYKCFEHGLSVQEKKSRVNEEKKKYYVAVTRSKKNLYITHSLTSLGKFGKSFQNARSQFVIE